MDYTKQEFRPLIYKDKEDIEEFDINDEKSLDAVMLNRIEESVITDLEGANEYILDIFNNAHYITILIMMEKRPIHFFRNYITISEHAGSFYNVVHEKNTYHILFSAFTMAMVCNYLSLLDKKYLDENHIMRIKLREHFKEYYSFTSAIDDADALYNSNCISDDLIKEYHVDKQSFTPRIIDRQAICDAEECFRQKFSSWDMLIKKNGFKSSEEFVKNICRTDEEVKLLTETISFEKGSFNVHNKEQIIDPDNSELLQARIRELQERIEELKKNQPEPITKEEIDAICNVNEDSESPQARIRELERELSKQKAEKEKLKKQLTEQENSKLDSDFPELDEAQKLSLHQKIVFFTTVTSVLLNKRYTNMSNLASFIASMCNEKPKTIAPMLSRIGKISDDKPNQQLSTTLHSAAQCVSDMLYKILTDETKHDKSQNINKIRENLLLNYPLPEDE